VTNLNPLDLLDKVLAEYASPRARRAIHAALMLVAALVTLYLAYEKDWMQALIALAATLYTGANKANTNSAVEPFPEEDGDAVVFADESLDDHDGEEADYDYGIVLADAEEPDVTGLPIETFHGGTGQSEGRSE
jgi:hypothetical protein